MSESIRSCVERKSASDIGLHQKLNKEQVVKMRRIFESHPSGRLAKHLFRRALKRVAGLVYTEDEFNLLYLKIDSERAEDICITWSAFLAHLILGFQEEQDTAQVASLELPITRLPKIVKSCHRHPVIRFTFLPEIGQDRALTHLHGFYISCSKDGVINYWTLDMVLQKTVISTCPTLKVQSTWILDIVCLPDINIICTASAERDLRFYDITAQKFALKVMINSLSGAVCAMHYTFYEDPQKKSKLIIGDMNGSVKMIEFISKDGGPLKSQLGYFFTSLRWDQFAKGAIPGMTVKEFSGVHFEWIRQVGFYEKIGMLVSIAPCSRSSMILHNLSEKDTNYIFFVQKGFWCFDHGKDKGAIIATGGPDCLVRVWNPFVTHRPVAVLRGHHSGVASVILQNSTLLISIGTDKAVKIWDVNGQTCIQTYTGFPASLATLSLTTYYNPCSRQVFIAGSQIASFQVYPQLNADYTDGYTHSKEVSVVLFNTLYRILVTCGFDSYIIIWDPFTARRLRIIKEAHIINVDGVVIAVAITAATFNPTSQLLVTGAFNGTLRVWNFNTGTCIRNMSIGENVIYSINWIKYRIFVVGENRCVAEFSDSNDLGASSFKSWAKRHDHDILRTAIKTPQTFVTASYTGEIIFWRLETAQPYGMYNVDEPTIRRQMKYRVETKPDRESAYDKYSRKKSRISVFVSTTHKLARSKSSLKKKKRQLTDQDEPCIPPTDSIQYMLILSTRKVAADTATLLVALATGYIQLWSHSPGGGYIESFKAVHNMQDYVTTMTTDKDNEYLITGHYYGYIKVWLIKNYGLPEGTEVELCMPKIRLLFPFTWADVITGRAKRSRRNEPPLPVLLSSMQGHYCQVNGLVFIDETQVIISCSMDYTARMWSIGGRYLHTLGSLRPFDPILPGLPDNPDKKYEVPADIARFCSSTTFKVLQGGELDRPLTKKQKERRRRQVTVIEGCYGERTDLNNILGHHFQLPQVKRRIIPQPVLDHSLKKVSVYNKFILPENIPVVRQAAAKLKKDAKLYKRRQTL